MNLIYPKRLIVVIAMTLGMLTGCASDTSTGTESNSSNVDADTGRPTISIISPTSSGTLSTSSSVVSIAGIASDDVDLKQVSWINDRGGEGLAAGAESWSIDNINIKEGINTLTVMAEDTSGNTALDTLIIVYSNGILSVIGIVDSSLIDREGKNAIYVYKGSVIPDDLGGLNSNPILIEELTRGKNCTWQYDVSSLESGLYTLALTGEAQNDESKIDDSISFSKTINLIVSDGGITTYDFAATNILRVGAIRQIKTIQSASLIAKDGDVIEIDAGIYQDDIAVWRQNNIVLRGVGGRPHLKATRIIPFTAGNDQENGMGIWVTRGKNIRVENIEFSGAAVPDLNGAGIRVNSSDITICNSYFHDNENGILGGDGHIIVEYSEFDNNGLGEYGKTHNMYISTGTPKFTLRYSYSHHANIGHNVKSRAYENHIIYNRIMDEAEGDASYAIDLPNGGLSYVIGNVIQQGPFTDNSTMVAYGAEGLKNPVNQLYMVNNTLVNDRGSGTFISAAGGTEVAKIVNNLFVGSGTIFSGMAGDLVTNLASNTPGFANRAKFDYRLTASSVSAIDKGSFPGVAGNYELTPRYQYLHISNGELRPADGALDIGAYEYSP